MEIRCHRLIKKLAAFAVSAVMLASLTACMQKPPLDTVTQTEPATTVPTEPITVEQAILQLQQRCDSLGFDNALDELEERNTARIGGDTYIRMQQHYKGLPVYGKTVVYAADESGALSSVTGNIQDIDPNIDLTPVITPQQAQESIRTYAKETLKLNSTDQITIEALPEDSLYIYAQGESPALAYEISIGSFIFLVDARDGQILSCASTLSAGNVTYTGPEGSTPVQGVAPIDGQYILKDSLRNIYVYDVDGKKTGNSFNVYNAPAIPHNLKLVTSTDLHFGDDNDSTDTSNIAYMYLNKLGGIYDFYYDRFNEAGTGLLIAVYNDALNDPNKNGYQLNGNNAFGGVTELSTFRPNGLPDTSVNPKTTICSGVVFGYQFCDQMEQPYTWLDVVGHEYTHTIYRTYHNAALGTNETKAIDEAIADIMGELFEASVNPDWENSAEFWRHGDRHLDNPNQCLYPAHINQIKPHETAKDQLYPIDKKANEKRDTLGDYGHVASTVISHGAYLMWNGIDGNESKKLSMDELAELYYRALLLMPDDCDFVTFRTMVETAAAHMEELTSEQRNCISEAFDQVGILWTADHKISTDGTLSVYDVNNDPYGEYILEIRGRSADTRETINGITGVVVSYHDIVTVNTTDPYAMKLPVGFYTVTVSSLHHPEIYIFNVTVAPSQPTGDNAATSIDLVTVYSPIKYSSTDGALVTDAYYNAFTLDDGIARCYHIPQINTDTCTTFNQTLYQALFTQLDNLVYSGIRNNGDLFMDQMYYIYGQKDNLVSIIVSSSGMASSLKGYNVSLVSGEEVSKDQILKAYGITESTFKDLTKRGLENGWNTISKNLVLDNATRSSLEEKTFSEENIASAIPFIGPEGNLCFIGSVYTLAGDGMITSLYDAQTGTHLTLDGCTLEHSEPEMLTEEEAHQRAMDFFCDELPEENLTAEDTRYYVAFYQLEDYTYAQYYVFYLRYQVSDDPSSEVVTLDIVYVNAQTGECTYTP